MIQLWTKTKVTKDTHVEINFWLEFRKYCVMWKLSPLWTGVTKAIQSGKATKFSKQDRQVTKIVQSGKSHIKSIKWKENSQKLCGVEGGWVNAFQHVVFYSFQVRVIYLNLRATCMAIIYNVWVTWLCGVRCQTWLFLFLCRFLSIFYSMDVMKWV